jgi:AraC family transcriptional regulator of adaptative response/methylated-DNA-[protein]-cysteine methyltransferase
MKGAHTMSASNLKQAMTTEADPRWAAVLARDARSDGEFYYSVKTTGVYCRPSCPSRRPLPGNVLFHPTRESAEQSGFRPCRRCRPDQPSLAERHAAAVTAACRRIEEADDPPTLEQLAADAGLSPYYFHRLFKSVAGITPAAYATAHRAARLREGLGNEATVTAAIVNAGYGSSSRFYEQANRVLGMTPGRYKHGGAETRIRFAVAESSLGALLVACSERGVCAIALGDDPDALVRELQDRFPRAELAGGDNEFEQIVAQVVAFVEEPATGLDLPLDIRGTAFQQRVWQALREIPAGGTASYAEIARRLGAPRAARAVAAACAANPLAVVVPCHRVVRNDGSLSGYRWGVERKRALLDREAVNKLKE